MGASGSDELAVNITGGDVTIRADNPSSGSSLIYGIRAKDVVIDTQGSVDIYGEKAAIYLNYENSKAEILNIGEFFPFSPRVLAQMMPLWPNFRTTALLSLPRRITLR